MRSKWKNNQLLSAVSACLLSLRRTEEEEEEQVEAQPSPAVRRRGHKREVASLLTDLGGYWKSPPSPCGRMRSSRNRRAPQRYVP